PTHSGSAKPSPPSTPVRRRPTAHPRRVGENQPCIHAGSAEAGLRWPREPAREGAPVVSTSPAPRESMTWLVRGHWVTLALRAPSELGIVDQLDEPRTAEE